MPMTMAGEVQLAAHRETVWEKLNDPDVLKVCIPGCEELVRSADNQFSAIAKDEGRPSLGEIQGTSHSERSCSPEQLPDFGRR